jgi:hypothetical protein
VEEVLATAWSELLGVKRVGRDNFFRWAAFVSSNAFISACATNFELSSQSATFDHPTIEELGRFIESACLGTAVERRSSFRGGH